MSDEATAKVLHLADDMQAEYAAAQTPASPTVPLGEAGPHSFDADAVGAPASEGPRWAPVDSDTGDLLDLIAEEHPALPSGAEEWEFFLAVLEDVARENGGVVDQNQTRPQLRGRIKASRTGAFFHRAARRGLIRAQGWNTSDDRESGNAGRPCKSYRWLGTQGGESNAR